MASSQTKFILVEVIQGDMDIRLLSRARAVFSAVIHMYSLNPPWSSDGSKENSNLLHGLAQVSLNVKFINKFKKKPRVLRNAHASGVRTSQCNSNCLPYAYQGLLAWMRFLACLSPWKQMTPFGEKQNFCYWKVWASHSHMGHTSQSEDLWSQHRHGLLNSHRPRLVSDPWSWFQVANFLVLVFSRYRMCRVSHPGIQALRFHLGHSRRWQCLYSMENKLE